jgi:hypothetical protein
MIETYKILNIIDKVQYEQILPLNKTTTRGHSKKLYKKNCRTNLPVSEVWNMGYSAPWTLLNNLFSSPGW